MKSKTGKAKYRLSPLTVTVICIAALLVFCYLFLLSEEHGFFPGNLVSRKIASSDLKKLGAEGFELTESNFDGEEYRFTYRLADGNSVDVKADAFKVTENGYFTQYLEDTEKEAEFLEIVKNYLEENWPDNGTSPEEISCDFKAEKKNSSDYDFDDKKILSTLKKVNVTVRYCGEEKTFDEYKKSVYEVVKVLKDKNYIPLSLQLFYDRTGESDEEKICQYESNVKYEQFVYDEKLLSECKYTHYIVEVSPSLAKKYRAREIAKKIYTWVIVLTVAAIVTTALVKKEKKRK